MSNVNETKTPKTIVNAEGKRVKRPVKTSARKRPNRKFIEQMADIRGFMSGNEKVQLKTLEIKNAMQRLNNRAMSENVNDNFTSEQCKIITKLINEFVKNIDTVIKRAN